MNQNELHIFCSLIVLVFYLFISERDQIDKNNYVLHDYTAGQMKYTLFLCLYKKRELSNRNFKYYFLYITHFIGIRF